jgi:hypothetical protein
MSISAIGSAAPSVALQELQSPAPAQATAKPATLPTDTVSLSSAGVKASKAGDVDHDGDSH